MRFQLSLVIASLSLLASSVNAQFGYCPTGQTQMCCQNLQASGNVGYYCSGPNQPFPCTSVSPPLKSMCCDTYALVPRGVSLDSSTFLSPLAHGYPLSIPEATARSSPSSVDYSQVFKFHRLWIVINKTLNERLCHGIVAINPDPPYVVSGSGGTTI
jgi:hypothetical protein